MAVDRVDLKVGRGRTLGIVGESGCGKSTLARLLVGLHVPTHGRVMFEGIDINDRDQAARNAGRKLQMVFQDPAASLNPRLRIGKSVAEPLYAMGIKDVAEPVNEMLSRVGLSPRYANRFPNELSGGQQQRVCIARALVGDAKLVIHDEAVSSLDVSLQAQVLRLLIELQDEFELTYVFISHDLAVVESVSDEIAVMYLGQIVERAPPSAIRELPKHPYTVSLKSAVPIPNPKLEKKRDRIILKGDVPDPANPPSGCSFRTRCPIAQEICSIEEPALQPAGPGHSVACHYPDRVDQILEVARQT